jgi:Flp pilus assembly protein TadD
MSAGKSPTTLAGPARPAETQADFEVDFFGQVLQRLPDYLDVMKLQATLLAQKGRREEALPMQRKIVQTCSRDAIAHYDLACTLSVLGHLSEAVVVLGRALQLGYQDFPHLEFDPDLDHLRPLPAYRELLASYGVKCEL